MLETMCVYVMCICVSASAFSPFPLPLEPQRQQESIDSVFLSISKPSWLLILRANSLLLYELAFVPTMRILTAITMNIFFDFVEYVYVKL